MQGRGDASGVLGTRTTQLAQDPRGEKTGKVGHCGRILGLAREALILDLACAPKAKAKPWLIHPADGYCWPV